MLRSLFTRQSQGHGSEIDRDMGEETTSSEGSSENPAPPPVAPLFFTASPLKLIVMSICTIGIYEIYWFYKNWKLIRERTGQKIRPFWRAVFSPIWAYSCFKEIKARAGECKIQESLPIGLLAIAYFTISVTSMVPEPYWLISLFIFLPLLPANSVAMKVNRHSDAGYVQNGRFSALNWVGIVVGGVLLFFAIIATFAPNAFSFETAALVDSPKSYNKGGVTFNYPGNWTVTEDGLAEESVRYLVLETAGDNSVSIQVYPATEALELLEYAQRYAGTMKEGIPIGSFGASKFSGIEEKDGNEILTEQLEMTVFGESIPYTRIYSRKGVGNVIAFISLQAISEEYEMVVGGFDQIIASLSYEGP